MKFAKVLFGVLVALVFPSLGWAQGGQLGSYNGFELSVVDTTPGSWDSRSTLLPGVSRVASGKHGVSSSTGNWHAALRVVDASHPLSLDALWNKSMAVALDPGFSVYVDVYLAGPSSSGTVQSFEFGTSLERRPNKTSGPTDQEPVPLDVSSVRMTLDSSSSGGGQIAFSGGCGAEAKEAVTIEETPDLVGGWYTIQQTFEQTRDGLKVGLVVFSPQHVEVAHWDSVVRGTNQHPFYRPLFRICSNSVQRLAIDNWAVISGGSPGEGDPHEQQLGATEALRYLTPTGEERMDVQIQDAVSVLAGIEKPLLQRRTGDIIEAAKRRVDREVSAQSKLTDNSFQMRAPAAVRAMILAAALRLVDSDVEVTAEAVRLSQQAFNTLCGSGGSASDCMKSKPHMEKALAGIAAAHRALFEVNVADVLLACRSALSSASKVLERTQLASSSDVWTEFDEAEAMAQAAGCIEGSSEGNRRCGKILGKLRDAQALLDAAEQGRGGRITGATSERVRKAKHHIMKAREHLQEISDEGFKGEPR